VDGSSLPAVKAALATLLAAHTNNVAYQSPLNAVDVLGEDGSGLTVWWDDDTNAEITMPVMTGGPHWFDELVTATLVIQTIAISTDDTQTILDARATETLGAVITIMADDPTLGITDTPTLELRTVLPVGWRYPTGWLGPDKRGARYELDIQIEARLKLTT
jgi:hypothetical protein